MEVAHRNLDGYGSPPIEWEVVERTMSGNLPQAPGAGGPGRHTAWLTTLDVTGRPHVRPLGILAHSGSWYFSSSHCTRNTRNVERDPCCVVSVATEPFDLVVEGVAHRVTGADELSDVAAAWSRDGWPATVAMRSPRRLAHRPVASRRTTSIALASTASTPSALRNPTAPPGST